MGSRRVIAGQWSMQLYTIHEASYDSLAMHDTVREQWIVSHVLQGDVRSNCGGGDFIRVRPGDVMIHPPRLPFSELADGPGTHHWMALDVRNADGVDLFRLHPVPQVITLRDPHRYSSLFVELLRLAQADENAYGDFAAVALTMQLLAILLEDADHAAVPPLEGMWTVDERFADVVRFMEARLHEKLARADLAALLHLSPNHFDKRFQAVYGVTAMDMLRDMRLRKARQLLERTPHTLEHIALMCGLGDAAYLSRQFMRRYGMTPGACRKHARSAQAVYVPAARLRPAE